MVIDMILIYQLINAGTSYSWVDDDDDDDDDDMMM